MSFLKKISSVRTEIIVSTASFIGANAFAPQYPHTEINISSPVTGAGFLTLSTSHV